MFEDCSIFFQYERNNIRQLNINQNSLWQNKSINMVLLISSNSKRPLLLNCFNLSIRIFFNYFCLKHLLPLDAFIWLNRPGSVLDIR